VTAGDGPRDGVPIVGPTATKRHWASHAAGHSNEGPRGYPLNDSGQPTSPNWLRVEALEAHAESFAHEVRRDVIAFCVELRARRRRFKALNEQAQLPPQTALPPPSPTPRKAS